MIRKAVVNIRKRSKLCVKEKKQSFSTTTEMITSEKREFTPIKYCRIDYFFAYLLELSKMAIRKTDKIPEMYYVA
jgi:hypothetical protein